MEKHKDYRGEYIETCKGPVPLRKALDIVRYFPDEEILLGLYAYAADNEDTYILGQTRLAQKHAGKTYSSGPVASPGNLPRRNLNMVQENEREEDDLLSTDTAVAYWRLLRKEHFVDENNQLLPETSRKQAMCIAEAFAEKLNLKAKWKTFEQHWGIRNLAQEKWDIQQTGLLPPRYKLIQSIFED